MPARWVIRTVASSVAILAILILLLPMIASAWFLNQTNAHIARASALPADAPARVSALADGQSDLAGASLTLVPRAVLAEARLLLARENAEGAITALDAGHIPTSSLDSIVEYVWGEAEWEAGHREEAFKHWRSAGAMTYFMQEAHRATDAHQWSKAADMARIAAGIDPNSPNAHLALGEALSYLGRIGEADDELERAATLTTDPELVSTIQSRLGEICAEQGDYAGALRFFEAARNAAPLDARPRTGYALVLIKSQPAARGEAIALLTQVLADSPWYTAAYIALANQAEATGDVAAAEGWFQKGLAKNPNDARLLHSLGLLYTRQERWIEARATLVDALRYETRADSLLKIAASLAEVKDQ